MSSIVKIYEFNSNSISNTEQFDFSSYKFSNTSYSKLFDVLNESTSPFQLTLKIHKIDNSNPNPLDLTTKENKIYYYNDKIYFTLDNDIKNTKLITIDLLDYSSNVKYYKQVNIDCGDAIRVKSNSYLFEDNLFQIKGCKIEMCFQIKDFKKDSLRKEYRVRENEEITFRNTPLIQEGGTTIFTQDSERELEKTKQVLRKISASDIGITVNHSQENIELTLGGFKEVQRSSGGGGMMMTSPGTSISTPHGTISIPPTYHYNPTMYGYNTYTNTRSVYFKALLDNLNFNHIQGNVSENTYDKIRDFEDNNDTDMTSETIFKVDGYYIFGYYKKWENKYYLRKFAN